MQHRKARKVLQSNGHVAESKEEFFPTILARWQAQESYRSSLKDCDIGEKEIIIYDQFALERHDHTATNAERITYSQKWVLSLNAEGKHDLDNAQIT